MFDELIDRIYEAATLPELWPRLLDEITIVGKGHFTALFARGNRNAHWVASERGVRISEEVASMSCGALSTFSSNASHRWSWKAAIQPTHAKP